jgi:hypothetical protein
MQEPKLEIPILQPDEKVIDVAYLTEDHEFVFRAAQSASHRTILVFSRYSPVSVPM